MNVHALNFESTLMRNQQKKQCGENNEAKAPEQAAKWTFRLFYQKIVLEFNNRQKTFCKLK